MEYKIVIDAMGGEMGFAADAVTIQSRTLNTSKGAAVRSKRVQADRRLYTAIAKETLDESIALFSEYDEKKDANGKPFSCLAWTMKNGRRVEGMEVTMDMAKDLEVIL